MRENHHHDLFSLPFATPASREKMSLPSQPLELHAHVFDVAFYPIADEAQPLATADVDGSVKLWRRCSASSGGEYKELQALQHHGGKSVRAVAFAPGGQSLLSASADGSCALTNTSGELIWTSSLLKCGVSSVAWADAHTFFAGDDDGGLRYWDVRQQGGPAWQLQIGASEKVDGSTNAVGCNWAVRPLQVAAVIGPRIFLGDLKQRQPTQWSAEAEEDYNCCLVLRDGEYVACGGESGVSFLRINRPDAPMLRLDISGAKGVNCLAAWSGGHLSGAGDGVVRKLSFPPGSLGVEASVGAHVTIDGDCLADGVDRLAVSPCEKFYATTSSDECVRFHALEDAGSGDAAALASGTSSTANNGGGRKKRPRSSKAEKCPEKFFLDL